MTLTAFEDILDTIDRLVTENRVAEIPAVVARARAELHDDEALVTTTQAAKLLGIGSINTVKAMVRGGEIREVRKVGNRTMIPLREIKRLQHTPLVHDLQAITMALSTGAPSGEAEETPMSQEQMDILEAGRPGTHPWQR